MANEVLNALTRALGAFRAAGIVCAVFGGIAAQVWGRLRATLDADILVDPGGVAPDGVVRLLRDVGFAHQDRIDRVRLDDGLLLRFHHRVDDLGTSLRVDVVLAGAPPLLNALARRVERVFAGQSVPVITCEDMIVLKVAAGRPTDRADAAELMENLGGQLDHAYIEEWVRRLGLLEELRSIRPHREGDTGRG